MNNLFFKDHKKALITGGAGFIGGALIRRLLKDTELKIFNLDKLGYASDLKNIENLIKSDNISRDKYEFIKFNLCEDKKIHDLINKIKPDLIFHLAAESHVDRSIEGPEVFINSNINGTFNLLEATRLYWEGLPEKKQKKFRFHHISTDEVFGSLSTKGFFTENSNYAPRSPYSASKAASDHLVNAWHHTYGLPVILTNCSNNFGPFQYPEKLIPLAIRMALRGLPIPMYANGQNVRDWLFVEDHIDALILAASLAKPGSNYCVGGFGERTNISVLLSICSILDEMRPRKNPYKNLIQSVSDRPGHDKRYAIDSSLIQKELGWTPNYKFEDALKITVDWYLRNSEWSKEKFA